MSSKPLAVMIQTIAEPHLWDSGVLFRNLSRYVAEGLLYMRTHSSTNIPLPLLSVTALCCGFGQLFLKFLFSCHLCLLNVITRTGARHLTIHPGTCFHLLRSLIP